MLAAQPAHAEFYRELPYDWTVTEHDDACMAVTRWDGEGSTELVLMKTVGKGLTLGLSNYNWSAAKRGEYDVSVILDKISYGGAKSVGFENSGRKGFLTAMAASFEADFAKAAGMRAYVGDTLIDNLSLKGSSAAIMNLGACYQQMKRRVDADNAKKAALSYIPSDPFAKAAHPPIPIGTHSDWATAATFRDKKSYAGLHGVVKYKATVNLEGKVVGCAITTSSGDEKVDLATCDLIVSRGRFEPAVGDDGEARDGSYDGVATWKM